MSLLPGALDLLNLSYVDRWSIAPMNRPQSVAEHSFRVAAIALFLADSEPELWPDVLQMAMRHDADEIYTGDMPGPDKDVKGLSGFKDASDWLPAYRVVKIADCIETGTWFVLWGNPRAWQHRYNQGGHAPVSRDIAKAYHYCLGTERLGRAVDAWNRIVGGYDNWQGPWTPEQWKVTYGFATRSDTSR